MRKLIIKNFGPVLDAELELKAVNLLVGEQSIGKSTIAKLITIMTDIFSLNTIISGNHSSWLAQLKTYGLDIYQKYDYHIQYEWIEQDAHLLLKVTKDNVITSFTNGGVSITDVKEIGKILYAMKPIFHQDLYKKEISHRYNL